jgi:hypothetical protein
VDESWILAVTPYDMRPVTRERFVQLHTLKLEIKDAELALNALLQTDYI